MASSEPATYDITSNHAASARVMDVSITSWSGVHADIFDVTPLSAHGVFTQNVADPANQAITSVTDGAQMVLWVFQGFTAVTAHNAPAGYDLHGSDLSQALSGAVCSKNIASAGAEAPAKWGNTSGGLPESITISLMLKPAD